MIGRSVLAAVLAAASGGHAPALAGTYVNERYGFSLTYPEGRIAAEPEDSANGDGRRFHAGGDVFVAAFAYGRLEERTPATVVTEAQRDCAGTAPTYRVVRRDLVALSCVHAGTVYYRKTILNADYETTLQAHYPARDKARWDPVIAGMARSLRGAGSTLRGERYDDSADGASALPALLSRSCLQPSRSRPHPVRRPKRSCAASTLATATTGRA